MKGNKYLPNGDILKSYLLNSNMPKANLKEILRSRGVFFNDESRENMAAFLTRAAVSSSEFEILQEAAKTKEENPKVRTQSIACLNTQEDLLEVIAPELDLRKLIDDASPFTNFTLKGSPSVTTIGDNPNHLELDFAIERRDLTKSWEKRTEQFGGKISIKRDGPDVGIVITQTHTSNETKNVADRAAKQIVKILQDKKQISEDSVVTRIKFSDFSNGNRVKFLKKLLQQKNGKELIFVDLKELGVRPAEDLIIPEEIRWMEKNFRSIDFRGDKIHTSGFLKDEKIYDYIEVYGMQARVAFEYAEFKGECEILCEFPELISRNRRDTELILSVDKINIDQSDETPRVSKIKEKILETINREKIAAFREFSSTNSL